MLGEGRKREGEKEREGERRSNEGGGGRTYDGKSPRDGCNTMSRIFIP